MANAGYSKDYNLMKQLARAEQYLEYTKSDCLVLINLKYTINLFVQNANITRCDHDPNRALCKRCSNILHNNWYNMIIKTNQIRQKYWYWNELKIK